MWHLPRKSRWRYQLLDSQDRTLRELDGVEGGSVELVALSRLGGSGSLTIREAGQDIDWMSHRVQCIYDPGYEGIDPLPIATMMLTSPVMTSTSTGFVYEVGLLSKMAVIDEDTVEADYTVPAGANVVKAVVTLITSTGESRVAATDSSSTLANAQTWEAGTSKLTIINDLLTAINYWSLWCDGSGQFRVEPWVAPGDRPVSYTFREDEASISMPGWEREQDLASVPNRFIVVGQGDAESAGVTGTATNTDPASPFSFQSRGRWITRTEEGVEVADQAAANALALRRLGDAMDPVARLNVTHWVAPTVPNDLVAFEPRGFEGRRATVQRLGYTFDSAALVGAEWREI